jgi:integrase
MIRRTLREMGVTGYSIHGLRKNAAIALAEAGCSPHEIMAITGHRTLEMVTHYAKRVSQRTLARSAMEKWESGKPKNATG